MPPKERKLTEDEIDQVERLASVLNQSQIADYLSISDRTFRRIMDRDESVMSAYKRGRAKAVQQVAGSLLQKAREGDTSSAIFYLKTQAGWKDTTVQQHEGSVTHTIKFE